MHKKLWTAAATRDRERRSFSNEKTLLTDSCNYLKDRDNSSINEEKMQNELVQVESELKNTTVSPEKSIHNSVESRKRFLSDEDEIQSKKTCLEQNKDIHETASYSLADGNSTESLKLTIATTVANEPIPLHSSQQISEIPHLQNSVQFPEQTVDSNVQLESECSETESEKDAAKFANQPSELIDLSVNNSQTNISNAVINLEEINKEINNGSVICTVQCSSNANQSQDKQEKQIEDIDAKSPLEITTPPKKQIVCRKSKSSEQNKVPSEDTSPVQYRRSVRRKLMTEKTLQCHKEKNSSALSENKYCASDKDSAELLHSGELEKVVKEKKKRELDTVEVEKILEGMEGEIDHVIEETAQKNKLTATNVKNILRHVITNEYVLAMVRNTMKSEAGEFDDVEEAVYEPKLTRSKAKELREKQAQLPWPVSSPLKQQIQSTSKKLLEEEFSDDESTSDEEYKPAEEECHSGDDEESAISSQCNELGSPISPFPTTPQSGCTFPDSSEEEFNRLIIAIPEVPDIELNENIEQVDKIALRTRSKLSLNDTPLETIEASFVAPDITVDMYDTHCHDEEWSKFLLEFTKPLDTKVVAEQPDGDDDDKDDPEYNFLEEEDVLDEWDLRNDRAVKISKKELNELMAEILEAAEQELNELEEEEEEHQKEESDCTLPIPTDSEHQPEKYMQHPPCGGDLFFQISQWMSTEERAQLEEQMRMHVQLLCQAFLLSKEDPSLAVLNDSSWALLEELKMFSRRDLPSGKKSTFYAHNIDDAINIISGFSSYSIESNKTVSKQPKTKSLSVTIPDRIKSTFAMSKAFMYPDLLPICGFQSPPTEKTKISFTPAEDNLIALGLEQFSELAYPVQLIHTFLLPTKTEQQIRFRIKNSKGSKSASDNPIKYYYCHKQAPPLPKIVRPFDPEKVKAPHEMPADVLPLWMKPFLNRTAPPIAPVYTPPKLSIVNTTLYKTPEKRKYNPILPRNHHVSPLKHINPILRKYGQKYRNSRRILPRVTFNLPSMPSKKNCTIDKKQCRRPLAFKTQQGRNISPKISNLHVTPQLVQVSTSDSTLLVIPASNAKASEITTLLHEPKINFPTVPVPVTVLAEMHTDIANVTAKQSENNITIKETNTMYNDPLVVTKASVQGQQTITLGECHISSCEDNTPDIEFSPNLETDTVTENESQTEMDACEGDDEVVDDEQDLAALMAASSTICRKQQHPVIRKRNKQQRDLESALALLSPRLMESDPKKEDRELMFAQSYLLRVTENLKNDPETYEKFLKVLCEFENNSKPALKLYEEMKEILKGHPALVDDFVGFLSPEQARDCGKLGEYNTLSKIRAFLRKVEVHFSQQPHHIQRILRTLSQLHQQTDVTSAAVISALQPLLRNQSLLLEELVQLLPDEPPPESLMTDFEEITIPESEAENTSEDSVEEIIVPETNDLYGCKDCPCSCHLNSTDVRMQSRSRHCVKCGTKFLDGKIYIQTGKVLKPAQVIYHSDVPPPSTSCVVEAQSKEESPGSLPGSDSPLSSPTSSPGPPSQGEDEQHDHEVPKANCSLQEISSPLTPDTPEALKTQAAPSMPDIINVATSEYRSSHSVAADKTAGSAESSTHHFHAISEDLSQDTSPTVPLPSDVIEDAILPPDTSNQSSCVPADFSHLRDVIHLGSGETCNEPENSSTSIKLYETLQGIDKCDNQYQQILVVKHSSDYVDSSLIVEHNAKSQTEISLVKQTSNAHITETYYNLSEFCKNGTLTSGLECSSKDTVVATVDFSSVATSESKWTREQDKIILQTCQKYGVTDEAFQLVVDAIDSKNVQQVKDRFHDLMKLFTKQATEETGSEDSE